MVHSRLSFRLIVEFISGLALIIFFGGLMLLSALAVSPFMALGMLIVFVLEYKRRT